MTSTAGGNDEGEQYDIRVVTNGDAAEQEAELFSPSPFNSELEEASTLPSRAESSTVSESEDGGAKGSGNLRVPRTRRPLPITPPLQEGEEPLTLAEELATHGTESLASSDSIPDDTPSVAGSGRGSPRSSTPVSRSSPASPASGRSPSSQPFERRFKAQRSVSGLSITRGSPPAFLTPHSRQSSLSSQITQQSIQSDLVDEKDERPWEVVRWTKLKKISAQAFSESGKRAFGKPTYLAVAAFIAVGTSRGLVLLFDYQQTLKSIVGQGTAATEAGRVTSVAISADHSTIASGHGDGSIFTWEVARPARPFLHIPPIDRVVLDQRTSDGHVAGSAVLHVGFLGIRHTALVSADDSGMAFSHLASRGLGPLTRNVKTTRILGRYPNVSSVPETPRKPSSVLSFSPLPLGNVEAATDGLGLTALLTPYLLVIVSTTPIAQTQFKMPRSKDITAHSAMTGCLAWFPSVRLKGAEGDADSNHSTTKLVFCWSNVLNVLEVTELPKNDTDDNDETPSLSFKRRGTWKCEESIVAVQWLSRSILVVLTLTQQLLILQDTTLTVADSSDLNAKHIYNTDLFSHQLQPLVDKLEANDPSMHGIVPHAYHMSFRAYKSRLFLLGANDVSMGAMSNWADRLVAYMEDGNYIGAIQLATSYYQGGSDIVTVGLPEDNSRRHEIVKDKLLEIISASLRYIFNDEEQAKLDKDIRTTLSELIEPVFSACLAMDTTDFLLDEVYEFYSDASCQDLFLYTLEPTILDGRLQSVSPTILKDLTNLYSAMGYSVRMEELICSLDTATLDIDQVSSLCKQHRLFNAYIHVCNQALLDYTAPLEELMRPLRKPEDLSEEAVEDITSHLFPYLAYILTNRSYPQGLDMPEPNASHAKKSIYDFLFSWAGIQFSRERNPALQIPNRDEAGPLYPTLTLLLQFDSSSMMSMLNEAFEDGFLNEGQDQHGFTRQKIVNILNEIKANSDLNAVAKAYVNIFIARNLARFPTFILLSGSAMRNLLVELCNFPDDSMAEECQLSVEYLLTVYHPTEVQTLIPTLEDAKFYKILKSVYRTNRQFVQWFDTHFVDSNELEGVFDCLRICMVPETGLSKGQMSELKTSILEHAFDLANISPYKTAVYLNNFAPDMLGGVYSRLDRELRLQYEFLQALFEPSRPNQQGLRPTGMSEEFTKQFTEQYIKLMCRVEPEHVADYIRILESADLNLKEIVPIMESSGIVDAAVLLVAQGGFTKDAMARLKKHLGSLQTALTSLVVEASNDGERPSELWSRSSPVIDEVQKFTDLGIWLCQIQTTAPSLNGRPSTTRRRSSIRDLQLAESELTPAEFLWLELIDTVVEFSRSISSAQGQSQLPSTPTAATHDNRKIADAVRGIVQSTFTALLSSTTSISSSKQKRLSKEGSDAKPTAPNPNNVTPSPESQPSFLPILTTLLHRFTISSPTLSDLRATLLDIFSAYAFEESLLSLASTFIDKDVFAHVKTAERRRARGWRPSRQVCEGCRRRCWGGGLGNGAWETWRERIVERNTAKRSRLGLENDTAIPDSEYRAATPKSSKGKGRAPPEAPSPTAAEETSDTQLAERHDALVFFECGHMWHQKCLERAMPAAEEGEETGPRKWRCVLTHAEVLKND